MLLLASYWLCRGHSMFRPSVNPAHWSRTGQAVIGLKPYTEVKELHISDRSIMEKYIEPCKLPWGSGESAPTHSYGPKFSSSGADETRGCLWSSTYSTTSFFTSTFSLLNRDKSSVCQIPFSLSHTWIMEPRRLPLSGRVHAAIHGRIQSTECLDLEQASHKCKPIRSFPFQQPVLWLWFGQLGMSTSLFNVGMLL